MFKTIAILASCTLAPLLAHADHKAGHVGTSCESLKVACGKAGFTLSKNDKKDGKSLINDCMGKFAQGEKVPGVDLDPADPMMAACKAELAQTVQKNPKKAENKAIRNAHDKMLGKSQNKDAGTGGAESDNQKA